MKYNIKLIYTFELILLTSDKSNDDFATAFYKPKKIIIYEN